VADVTVLYVNSDGSLTQLQDGDNLLTDNLNRKSSSGNITIGGNVTGAGEDVVIGASLSATGEVLLGSVASQARVLGDFVVDGALGADLDGGAFDISNITVLTFAGSSATSGDINLPDDGSIFSYGGGAERRLFNVTGSAVFLGENGAGGASGVVSAFDIEASTNVDFSIGAADDVIVSIQSGFIQILEAGGTPSSLRFYDGDTSNYVAFRAPSTIGADVTWILPTTDSTGTQYLRSDGAGNLSWGTIAGGGDVTGPASSLDNVVCRFDGTTGKAIQGGTYAPTYDDLGNFYVNADGGTISPYDPKLMGFANLSSGEAGRFQFGDAANALQNGYDQCMQLYSYHTLVLMGDRQSGTGPAFVAGTAEDISLLVLNSVAGDVVEVVRGAAGQTADLQQWQNSAGTSLASITSAGHLNLINHDVDNARTVSFNAAITGSGAGGGINWTNGQKQQFTMTGAGALTFTAPPGPCQLTLVLINAGTYAPTWPAAVGWAGQTEPPWTLTGTDIVTFYYDGTTYWGVASLNFG